MQLAIVSVAASNNTWKKQVHYILPYRRQIAASFIIVHCFASSRVLLPFEGSDLRRLKSSRRHNKSLQSNGHWSPAKHEFRRVNAHLIKRLFTLLLEGIVPGPKSLLHQPTGFCITIQFPLVPCANSLLPSTSSGHTMTPEPYETAEELRGRSGVGPHATFHFRIQDRRWLEGQTPVGFVCIAQCWRCRYLRPRACIY